MHQKSSNCHNKSSKRVNSCPIRTEYLAAWIHDVFAVRNICAPFEYPAAQFFTAHAMGLTKANRLVAFRRWFQTPLKLQRWRNEGPAVEQLFGDFFEQGETNLWNMLDPRQRR